MTGVTVTVGGRTIPGGSIGAGLSLAQGILVREDQARELPVIVDGKVEYVVETKGDGIVTTRKEESS